jgi:hypothetical protein
MSHNPITGDRLASKIGDREKFDKGYDLIFGKSQPKPPELPAQEWPLPTEEEKCA